MKRLSFLGLIFLLVLFSCVSTMQSLAGLPQEDPDYKIESVRMHGKIGIPYTYVTYDSKEFLMQDETKRAEAEMREPDYSGYPENGFITVMLTATTIEAANSEHLTIIFIDSNGNPVAREKGRDKIANYISGGSAWYTISVFSVPEGLEFPFSVRTVHQFYPEDYYEWRVVRND